MLANENNHRGEILATTSNYTCPLFLKKLELYYPSEIESSECRMREELRKRYSESFDDFESKIQKIHSSSECDHQGYKNHHILDFESKYNWFSDSAKSFYLDYALPLFNKMGILLRVIAKENTNDPILVASITDEFDFKNFSIIWSENKDNFFRILNNQDQGTAVEK